MAEIAARIPLYIQRVLTYFQFHSWNNINNLAGGSALLQTQTSNRFGQKKEIRMEFKSIKRIERLGGSNCIMQGYKQYLKESHKEIYKELKYLEEVIRVLGVV